MRSHFCEHRFRRVCEAVFRTKHLCRRTESILRYSEFHEELRLTGCGYNPDMTRLLSVPVWAVWHLQASWPSCASGACSCWSATSRLGVSRTHSLGRAAGLGMSGFITWAGWAKACRGADCLISSPKGA